MPTLTVKQPFTFRGFDVPNASVQIDWVSFDRCEQRAEIVLGIYRIAEDAAPETSKAARLDTVHLVFQNVVNTQVIDGKTIETVDAQYTNLLTQYPEIFMGIVAGVFTLAATLKPETFVIGE